MPIRDGFMKTFDYLSIYIMQKNENASLNSVRIAKYQNKKQKNPHLQTLQTGILIVVLRKIILTNHY